MKTILLAALFGILAVSTQAEQAASSSAAHRSVDISNMMQKPAELPEDSGFKINVTCKTDSGKEIKKGDKGYDDCMNSVATKASEKAKK